VRLRVIACEVFFREVSAVASRSPHTIDVEWLPKGLHDQGGAAMRERLQQVVDATDASIYEGIVLAYGLCNNGLVGLTARGVPLIVPRSHDCIGIFMGGADRYATYFEAHPGTYFRTSGWIERGGSFEHSLGLPTQPGSGAVDFEALAARYGEDNARYLMEELGDTTCHYSRLTFIRMGIEPDDRFLEQARQEASERGWVFECLEGDLGVLDRLVNGPWEGDDLLVVPPGARVVATHDARLVAFEAAE
jgi:hypothetical protein